MPLIVSDNGVGVTEEELQSIRNAPHYMVCDSKQPGNSAMALAC